MTRYRIEGVVVDTARAVDHWCLEDEQGCYGIVEHTLYRTRRGRWWLETHCSWTGEACCDGAEFVGPVEAVRLLDEAGADVAALAQTYKELAEHLAVLD